MKQQRWQEFGKKRKSNVLLKKKKKQEIMYLKVQISSGSPYFNTVMFSHPYPLYVSIGTIRKKEKQIVKLVSRSTTKCSRTVTKTVKIGG